MRVQRPVRTEWTSKVLRVSGSSVRNEFSIVRTIKPSSSKCTIEYSFHSELRSKIRCRLGTIKISRKGKGTSRPAGNEWSEKRRASTSEIKTWLQFNNRRCLSPETRVKREDKRELPQFPPVDISRYEWKREDSPLEGSEYDFHQVQC